EAAGFNIIIIETVGVGQSETDVKNMVDFFLLLMLPGAGDELQGIKKGIMEMADLIVINKADTDNLKKVQEAKHHYKQALHLFVTSESGWNTKVLSCSALEKTGIEEIWKEVKAFEKLTHDNGYFLHNRKLQNISWMQSQLNFLLQSSLKENDNLKKLINQEEQGVAEGKISATAAARNIFNYWIDSLKR
ncbi:MAG TPA: methylmalonyl Co-A mutase-associated GTPase MeaB, partial [Cyclobacteriaceae bacterium]|nr:methylmalonyl Co-A mutase-associated GTPase MeaB [Cyclobacteriaceae bacterium]